MTTLIDPKTKLFLVNLLFVIFSLTSCKKDGCTDSTALNFDSKAKKNNGTCIYGPTLTIFGSADTTIFLNNTYIDPGAEAVNKDGTAATLLTEGNVNTDSIGIYYITFTASNENQSIEKNRKVTVLANYGDYYQGGLVFHYFEPNETGFVSGEIHGLISAANDQSSGLAWGCNSQDIITSDNIGYGISNTMEIVNQCNENNTAAKICHDLQLNGFDDWFLPSKNEIQLMYNNLHLNGMGSFSNTPGSSYYWSSSQFNNYSAWYNYFNINYSTTGSKTGTLKVRAIRQF
jgi:hypothetical protein